MMSTRTTASRPATERFPLLALSIVLILGMFGCSNPLSPRESHALRAAEARWRSHNIRSYTFEMRTGCYCPPEINEWAVVEARDGQVVSARSLSGVSLTGYNLSSRKSVEQLFDAAKSDPDEWVADIDLTFDAKYGYPTRINFDSKPNIADAGLVYEARNLKEKAE